MADEGKSRHNLWASEASLSLLGPLRLFGRAGEDLTPKPRKTRALLAIVALAKGPVPRSRLADLLWGDRGEEQAKASLRQALYELRDLGTAGFLTVERGFVAIGPKRLSTDLGEIEDLVAKGQPADFAEALQEAGWPVLSDLDDVTPELDEWLREERSRIATLIVQRGAEEAEIALSSGDAASARRIADCLERIDPLDERAARVGARADLATGDRASAHRRVGRLEQKLRDELGLEPASETRALLSEAPGRVEAPKGLEQRPVAVGGRISRRVILACVAALALLLAGAALVYWRGGTAAANPSVAVLPFHEAGQRTQGYFASGVSDEILNLLSHERTVRVIGRVSAAEIAGRPNSLEAAQKLGITHLLDGSVQTAGDRVLVIVTLTRVSDGAQMWSEKYERKLGDIFAVQSEIASTVASRLSRSFGSSVNQTTTPEVYDRYLAARQLLRDRREVTLKEADRLLREAIRLDPNYAPAYAELSQVLILRSDHPTSYGTLPFRQARAEAETLARKAIALDPNLGDAYAALGFLYLYDKRATPYYQKAVALSPQRSEYHRWLAQSLWLLNRYDEAIAEYRRAIEIDPLWGINYEHLTGQLHFIGRDAEANEVARRFLALSSDQRGKLQLLRSMANDESRAADNLRYARALYAAYPQERIMKFWLASPLSLLGENRQAAQLMASDPTAHAALTGNWPQLARLTEGLGRDYWERATLWNTEKLLVASGRSDVVVRLYDQAVPFIRSGALDPSLVMTPDTVLALRIVGRNADANSVLASAEKASAKLPPRGVGHIQRELDLIAFAALKGRNDEALSRLGALTRTNAVAVGSLPAMSLTNNPILAGVKNDPRLLVSDERIRLAVNAERAKANLPPISREAWISDPKSLLTKN